MASNPSPPTGPPLDREAIAAPPLSEALNPSWLRQDPTANAVAQPSAWCVVRAAHALLLVGYRYGLWSRVPRVARVLQVAAHVFGRLVVVVIEERVGALAREENAAAADVDAFLVELHLAEAEALLAADELA